MTLFDDAEPAYKMREPCRFCGHELGRVLERNGQDTVRCLGCDRHVYNAPRVETGKRAQTHESVHRLITHSQRSRVLRRAKGCCELTNLCVHWGTPKYGAVPLHIGHFLSKDAALKAAKKYAIEDAEIRRLVNHDANLYALCEDCNLALGRETPEPVLYLRFLILSARVAWGSE